MYWDIQARCSRIIPDAEYPPPELAEPDATHAMILRRLLGPLCADAEPYISLILQHYPSPALALCCSEESLIEIGLPPLIAASLASLKMLLQEALLSELRLGPVMSSSQTVINYLQSLIGYAPEESVVVFYLDRSLRLIATDRFDGGNQIGASVKIRTIARRCLDLHATGIIIAHNHPSGNVLPSGADFRITRTLSDSLGQLGIKLFDHLLVSKGKNYSILHDADA